MNNKEKDLFINGEKDNDKEEINTSNIFDEFEIDEETKKELELEGEVIKKDWIYYLNIIGNIFKYINFLLFFIIIFGWMYIYIQKTDSEFFEDKDYLSPFCSVLLWIDNNSWICSWLNIFSRKVDNKINEKQKQFVKKSIDLLEKQYKLFSLDNSNEALFIKDKIKNISSPEKVLDRFDKLKNEFTWLKKDKIKCSKLIINTNILEWNCTAYTDYWDEEIPWYNWELTVNTLKWTSITLASSFLNFLANSKDFDILDQTKAFKKDIYIWEWNYTYKTDFKFKAQYNNDILNTNL